MHLDIFCASALATPDPEPPLLFFIDFETTGLSVTNDQIVEFGVVSMHGAVFSTAVPAPTTTFAESPLTLVTASSMASTFTVWSSDDDVPR